MLWYNCMCHISSQLTDSECSYLVKAGYTFDDIGLAHYSLLRDVIPGLRRCSRRNCTKGSIGLEFLELKVVWYSNHLL